MAPSIFAEEDFSRIFNDVNGYRHTILDRIRERNWYKLVYVNTNVEIFYCPELMKKFYLNIDTNTIEHKPIFCTL